MIHWRTAPGFPKAPNAGLETQSTPRTRKLAPARRDLLTNETTKFHYTHGVADAALIAPESYTLDQALLNRRGKDEYQLDLLLDYRSNVALYQEFQEYFRTWRPPTLAVWGANDPFFLPAGS